MHTPEEVQQVAEYIGMVLRSTGKVKRGIGTIRQDVNISIAGGARVEIKGVQELDLIAEVVRRESPAAAEPARDPRGTGKSACICRIATQTDVTALFKETKSAILKKAKKIYALEPAGFCRPCRPRDPARTAGSGVRCRIMQRNAGSAGSSIPMNCRHMASPLEEVARLREHVHAAEQDCVIIIAGASESRLTAPWHQVIRPGKTSPLGQARAGRNPEDARRAAAPPYMRPLPGAARMYPETDVLPVRIDEARWNGVAVPELLTVRAERFTKESGSTRPSPGRWHSPSACPFSIWRLPGGSKPTLASRTLLATITEIRRGGADTDRITDDAILAVLHAVGRGTVAKEAIPEILAAIAGGSTVEAAMAKLAPAVSRDELEAVIKKIVADREEFIAQKQKAALGPLMGVVMQEVRGSVDGKVVSELAQERD